MKIIAVNGITCAGKTTLIKELQNKKIGKGIFFGEIIRAKYLDKIKQGQTITLQEFSEIFEKEIDKLKYEQYIFLDSAPYDPDQFYYIHSKYNIYAAIIVKVLYNNILLKRNELRNREDKEMIQIRIQRESDNLKQLLQCYSDHNVKTIHFYNHTPQDLKRFVKNLSL